MSNGVVKADSTTKIQSYVNRAKECGMTSFGFSEHGNIFSWYDKKCAIEAAGMKYIHAIETYVTERIDIVDGQPQPKRDNYHCVLVARDFEGFLELNRLATKAFDRDDGHFYYAPRITFDELCATSNHILVTTACLGGLLGKTEGEFKESVIRFLRDNKHRCFLEVQHHKTIDQLYLNKEAAQLSRRYGIPLIAGTDTHSLTELSAASRLIMQKAETNSNKKARYDNEDDMDLTFKTLDELVAAYQQQGALSEDEYMEAIDNTNKLADMVQPFEISTKTRYPQLYDDPEAVLLEVLDKCIKEHPFVLRDHTRQEIDARIEEELKVYRSTDSITYTLLYYRLIEWCNARDIYAAPGRGSAAGSMVCYVLGITDVDPLIYNLNFNRFLSEGRVSPPDIDRDYDNNDRERIFEYLLRDHMELETIQSCQIITYQTVQMRDAIAIIGRGLDMSPLETRGIAKQERDGDVPKSVREQYPELFRYADDVVGMVGGVSRHAAGVVITDLKNDLASNVGMHTSSVSPYNISCLDMSELERIGYVKFDMLSIKYFTGINSAMKLAGIKRLRPGSMDFEDDAVWKSLREDTTGIFQFSEPYAQKYVAKIMSDESLEYSRQFDPNLSRIIRLALASAMLRPGAASVRDAAAEGFYQTYPIPELNELLKSSMGTLILQESLMAFLVQFCGYTSSESDYVRKCVAKKKGTETLLPEIKQRFLDYTPAHYDVSMATAEKMIEPFLQTVLDSASYSFNFSHALCYAIISYMCAWLRHYYPLEFVAGMIDAFKSKNEQVTAITAYAKKHNIKILPARYGKSRSFTNVVKDLHAVSQNLSPIKNVSMASAEALYEISQNLKSDYFIDVLAACTGTAVNAKMLESLIWVDFFEDFGNINEMLQIQGLYKDWKAKKQLSTEQIAELELGDVSEYASNLNDKGKPLKNYKILDPVKFLHTLEDKIKCKKLPDVPISVKIKQQKEMLGYINYHTDKPEDRYKLFVLDIKPVLSKKTGVPWVYNVDVVSLGSGKQQTLNLPARVHDLKPLVSGDIIQTWFRETYKQGLCLNKRGYWELAGYDYVKNFGEQKEAAKEVENVPMPELQACV